MMFYSQCLLDKKGPLGIIWVAAHLEKKLRKNQVTETSISAAVDTIIYSKVPIALRLSGHLLFGVTRIYSRKVNYLYQDCGEALLRIKRVFHSAHVDLPSDSNTAPFHAITLPETSELEFIELDNIGYECTRDSNAHVSTHDQITLHERPQDFEAGPWLRPYDQVHGTNDTSTMFYENQGNQRQTSCQLDSSILVVTSLEEDVLPPLPLDGPFGFGETENEISDSLHSIRDASLASPSVSTTTVPICELAIEETSQNIMKELIEPTDIPERETLRGKQHVLVEPHFMGSYESDMGKEYTDIGDIDKGQRTETKVHFLEKAVAGTKLGLPTSPTTPKSISGDDNVLASILGGDSSAMNVMLTPKTPATEERRPRSRKRKQIIDESIVLQNEYMRQQLNYTDDIRRIRRKIPCTVSEVRMAYRVSHMVLLFLEPSLPGICNELQELYKRVVTDLELKSSSEDMSWELKGISKELQGNVPAKAFHAPEMKKNCNAHEAMICDTPPSSPKLDRPNDLQMTGTEEPRLEAVGAQVFPSEPVIEPVTARVDVLEMVIPSPALEVGSFNTAQTIPTGEANCVEVSVSDEEHDQGLRFLEEDSRCEGDNIIPEQHGTGDSRKAHLHFDTNDLPTRTRAVAQYLKTRFENSVSHQTRSKLSLDRVLRGRTKKEAARMFFEILALRSKNYIEIEQEAAYADILASAKPKLCMGN